MSHQVHAVGPVGRAARQDLGVIDHQPDREGQDWNNVLHPTREPKPGASPVGTTAGPGPT